MRYQITAPSVFKGLIDLPASKSISNRALLVNALAHGERLPEHISDCDDTFVMTRALNHPTETIDIMAAGTAMRFLTAFYAVREGNHIITGTERMKQRPIRILVDALRMLGANIRYVGQEGFPPLQICGTGFRGGTLQLPGNVSSQYISALLMIGPTCTDGLTLELMGDIISRPYIDLTLSIMHSYGAKAAWKDDRTIHVENTPYKAVPFYIEGDWSAASYWYQMVALSPNKNAEIILKGLFSNSHQGDAAVCSLFEELGVHTHFYTEEDKVPHVRLIKQPATTSFFSHNLVNQPDLAQTFAVTCAMLNVPFHLTGLQSLKIKETDRIAALIQELGKLGYVIREANGSELIWNGEKTEHATDCTIDTYEDHRMAMAFAPCCLVLPEICINHPEVVSKSYPTYWEHFKQVGFNIQTL